MEVTSVGAQGGQSHRTEIRSPVARPGYLPSLHSEAGGGQERIPLPPERGAVARAGAGNSRGLSAWRSSSGGARRRLPLSRAGRGRWAPGAARAGLPEWVGGRRVSQLQPGRGRRRARTTRPLLLSRPASREPPAPPLAAPAPWPSPPPSLTHPPGRPGPRPSRCSSSSPHSLRPGCSCRSPASPRSLRADSSSFSSSASPFTHTHARAPWLAGPPPFLQASSPSQSFKRRCRGVGGGLMSLQHHAAAAEEGESYTRAEKHSR